MALNLESLPEPIREDIEVQSLGLMSGIRDHVVVIGGWGVRAWTHHLAARNTIDVDAVARPDDLEAISRKLGTQGLAADEEADWGVRFRRRYVPASDEARRAAVGLEDVLEAAEIRVEVSPPKLAEKRTHHYFEFHPENAVRRRIASRGRSASVRCQVAAIQELAANKIGLPTDYKNVFDLALLLTRCQLDEVVGVITSTDDWKDMVLRRIPKVIGRVQRADNLAHILLRSFNLDIEDFLESVTRIRDAIA